MEFINKLTPIVIPLLTAIAGLFTAWFKTRAARAEAKKAEASANTGGITQKLSVGTTASTRTTTRPPRRGRKVLKTPSVSALAHLLSW